MLLLKNYILVLTIPLASHYLSTILTTDLLFIISLFLCYISEIYGGLFQTILLTFDKSILNLDLFVSMSLLPIVLYNSPRVLYINAKTDYKEILSENKGKSGIYIFINKINGNQYVGSAADLGDKKSGRLNRYYRPSYLTNKKLGASKIRRAILKYNYHNFMVGILEYCSIDKLIEREQFYIDVLAPKYNILTAAKSSLGYKHSYDSLKKMSKSRPNFSPSKDHKEAIRLANANKILTLETKSRISASLSHPIYVYTPNLSFLVKYSAITIAKLELKISPTTIKKYCISGETYKNKYRFSYIPLSDNKNQ
jgi:group I intron endonuclease